MCRQVAGGGLMTISQCERSVTSTTVCPTVGGGSTPSRSLHFMPIEKRKAMALIIEHHYLHRKCPISWAWGIEVGGKILGVMTVGKPCSWSATCGVVGEKYADMKNPAARSKNVYE